MFKAVLCEYFVQNFYLKKNFHKIILLSQKSRPGKLDVTDQLSSFFINRTNNSFWILIVKPIDSPHCNWMVINLQSPFDNMQTFTNIEYRLDYQGWFSLQMPINPKHFKSMGCLIIGTCRLQHTGRLQK